MTPPAIKRSRYWPAAAVLFVAVATAYLFRSTILAGMGRFLDVGEPPEKVDWVFLLPGDLENRPFAAAALSTEGFAERVLIPTNRKTAATTAGDGLETHEALRRILLARGVSADAIEILPADTDSTFGDANALAQALERHPHKRVTLVTSDFHTRRTRQVFRRVLGERAAELRVVGVPVERFGPDDWWRTEEGAIQYGAEYVKLVSYYFLYDDGILWVGGALLGLFVVRIAYRRRKASQSTSVSSLAIP